MTSSIQTLNFGIDMGTKYLINESAYFLGNIFASNESVIIGNKKYWIAPVRYNNQYVNDSEFEQHFDLIKMSANKIGKETISAESIRKSGYDTGKFNRLRGFGTFFESPVEFTLESIIDDLYILLKDSTQEILRSFLVGMFDGRGSVDYNKKSGTVRYYVLDCENSILGAFLSKVVKLSNLDFNYNTSRDRLEGGTPRKDQLRIKGREPFLEKIGFISPKKFAVAYSSYPKNKVKELNNILVGLKSV